MIYSKRLPKLDLPESLHKEIVHAINDQNLIFTPTSFQYDRKSGTTWFESMLSIIGFGRKGRLASHILPDEIRDKVIEHYKSLIDRVGQPYKIRIIVPLVDNNEKMIKIHELIDIKKKMLLEKQKKLQIISKQNHFLDVVKNDYVKFYNYISQQKQDQITAMELLNDYIKELTISGKLSKHNIEDARVEQEKIIKEIKSIRKGLDSIIDNTNNITYVLKK
jgi:hypothetical protein